MGGAVTGMWGTNARGTAGMGASRCGVARAGPQSTTPRGRAPPPTGKVRASPGRVALTSVDDLSGNRVCGQISVQGSSP